MSADSLRRMSIVAAGLLLLAAVGVAAYYLVGEPHARHVENQRRVRAAIKRLALKRPPTVPRGQWEYMVGWTINLNANCAGIQGSVPDTEMRAFIEEFERRLEGPVDLATIDWIWDEYVRFTRGGQAYSDKWRPTRDPLLEHAQPGCFGIPVN